MLTECDLIVLGSQAIILSKLDALLSVGTSILLCIFTYTIKPLTEY